MSGRGVTFARGFVAGAAAAGIRTGRPDRLDVALIASERPCAAAGVLTRNEVIAAPCVLTREHLATGRVRAIVANAGNANACTGARGERDAAAMAEAAGARLGLAPEEVAVASTGVIGVPLPTERIAAAIAGIACDAGGWDAASRAILTTDTRPKVHEREAALPGGSVRIGGMAKGAGMIHPDMATLLAFITTDAAVPPDILQAALRLGVADTFNAISVDGDTSTNDMVLVLANGASGVAVTEADAPAFGEALTGLCHELALAVVSDGEGVTKVFEVRVTGGATPEDARVAARAVTNSNLVRTAVHGSDPNWGRVLAAAGRSGARVEDRRASVRIGSIPVLAAGAPCEFDREAVRALLAAPRIVIGLDLGLGAGAAVAWGGDLSAEYVRINADYTT